MKFLLIHKSFPGQFKHIARKLASDGHEVFALSIEKPEEKIPGVNVAVYSLVRAGVIGGIHGETPIYWDVNTKLIRAESCAYAMMKIRSDGFVPDVVYAHPGWGEATYVRDVFPDARLVLYGEWFYNTDGQEVGFDPEYPPSEYDKLKAVTKNIFLFKALNDADAVISPTEWQKSRFPAWCQDKIKVIHEGIDHRKITTGKPSPVTIGEKSFSLGDPVVTFASRYLEPLRGFHIFMRAIPLILSKKPDAHIFILGSDSAGVPGVPSYGGINPNGKTWKEEFLHLIKGYEANVHFMGFLPYPKYLSILKLSSCHVYLTYPFVLGWSFLEASVLGIPTVASNTPPVTEFAPRLSNVVKLVDFFNHEELAEAVVSVLATPGKRRPVVLKELDVKNTVVEVEKVLNKA